MKGKIIFCEAGGKIKRLDKGYFVREARCAGIILMNEKPQGFTIQAEPHVLPAAHISFLDGPEDQSLHKFNIDPCGFIFV